MVRHHLIILSHISHAHTSYKLLSSVRTAKACGLETLVSVCTLHINWLDTMDVSFQVSCTVKHNGDCLYNGKFRRVPLLQDCCEIPIRWDRVAKPGKLDEQLLKRRATLIYTLSEQTPFGIIVWDEHSATGTVREDATKKAFFSPIHTLCSSAPNTSKFIKESLNQAGTAEITNQVAYYLVHVFPL